MIHQMKMYRFPNLINVYTWLDEVRELENKIDEFNSTDENLTKEEKKLRRNTLSQIKVKEYAILKKIAEELVPEEIDNRDLCDYIRSLFFEELGNVNIVRCVIDAKKELFGVV